MFWDFKAKKYLSGSKGFSIVEMLIVIAIMGVVGGALVANYRGGQRDSNLRNSAEELVGVLRRTQSYALSGFQFEGLSPDNYRVNFNLANNTQYQTCANMANCTANIVETVILPDDVYVEKIILEKDAPVETNVVDVIFPIPYADIQFASDNFSNEAISTLTITLKNFNDRILQIKIDPIAGKFTIE